MMLGVQPWVWTNLKNPGREASRCKMAKISMLCRHILSILEGYARGAVFGVGQFGQPV